MQKLKNLIKFLWNDLYNKRSVMVVNIYNLIMTAWIAFILAGIFKNLHDECLGSVFAILLTLFPNVVVYFICHIAFFIQIKKNKTMKDNPIIESKLYRVISILSIFVVCFNYLVFVIFFVYYLSGQLF